MKPYLDTNFLLRTFLEYEASGTAFHRFNALRLDRVGRPITWLHRVEYANALQLLVFQSRAGGVPHVTPENAALAQLAFESELQPNGALTDVEMSARGLATATGEISSRHTAKHGFRTYDIIHVASALLLECDTFWSFDAKASKLAALEGLKTLPRS